MYDISLQTKTNITKMESFQRYKTSVEGQDQTEQRYMEMLAYAIHKETEHFSLPVRFPVGC